MSVDTDSPVLPILGLVAALSVVTGLLYGWDKFCATRGARRVPEVTLHLLALFGGWPGAWLAQRMFRHKTAKPAFRAVFWLTVIIHVAAMASVLWVWCARP